MSMDHIIDCAGRYSSKLFPESLSVLRIQIIFSPIISVWASLGQILLYSNKHSTHTSPCMHQLRQRCSQISLAHFQPQGLFQPECGHTKKLSPRSKPRQHLMSPFTVKMDSKDRKRNAIKMLNVTCETMTQYHAAVSFFQMATFYCLSTVRSKFPAYLLVCLKFSGSHKCRHHQCISRLQNQKKRRRVWLTSCVRGLK